MNRTEGPWEAINYSGDWTVRRVGADKNEADVTDTFHDKVSLMEGDAKLIAAAPDMAEALKKVRWVHYVNENDPFFSCHATESSRSYYDDTQIRSKPQPICDCGADEHNAIIDAALAKAGVE